MAAVWRLPLAGAAAASGLCGDCRSVVNTDWPYCEQIKRIGLPHKCNAGTSVDCAHSAGCDNGQAAQRPDIFQKTRLDRSVCDVD